MGFYGELMVNQWDFIVISWDFMVDLMGCEWDVTSGYVKIAIEDGDLWWIYSLKMVILQWFNGIYI